MFDDVLPRSCDDRAYETKIDAPTTAINTAIAVATIRFVPRWCTDDDEEDDDDDGAEEDDDGADDDDDDDGAPWNEASAGDDASGDESVAP